MREDPEQPLIRPSEGPLTVPQVLNRLGFGWYQYGVLAMFSLMYMGDAMEILLLSFLSPILGCHWKLTDVQRAAITMVVFFGWFFGAFFFGWLADQVGRKRVLLYVILTCSIAGIASSLAPSLPWMLVFRALVGFGNGGLHVGVTLFSELLPSSERAKGILFLQFFQPLAAIIEAGIAWVVIPRYGWRVFAFITSMPVAVSLFIWPMFPESPIWLVMVGRNKEAGKVLEEVAHANGVIPKGKTLRLELVERKRKDVSTDLLFRHPTRGLIMKLAPIWFGMSFLYYGSVLYVTRFLKLKGHKPTVASDCNKYLDDDEFLAAFLSAGAESLGLGLAAAFVSINYGRKSTLSFTVGLIAVLCVAMAFDQEFVTFATSRGLMAATVATMYIYTPELLHSAVRSMGMGLMGSSARIGGFLTPLVAEVCSTYSVKLAWLIYAAVACMMFVCVRLIPLETARADLFATPNEIIGAMRKQNPDLAIPSESESSVPTPTTGRKTAGSAGSATGPMSDTTTSGPD